MKYISEERLREKFEDIYWKNSRRDKVMEALIKECSEINPWQPMCLWQDISSAPKDRRIFLFYPETQRDYNITIGYAGEHNGFDNTKATHWQELPPNPL